MVKPCENEECGRPFVAKRCDTRFCSASCRARAHTLKSRREYLLARTSVAARAFRVHQVDRGENLRGRKPPVWAFVNLPMNDASSTEIRNRGGWRA